MSEPLTSCLSSNAALRVRTQPFAPHAPVPRYLAETYWWAYLHPRAVRFFERQWLVNAILWGNYRRLQDVALAEIAPAIHKRVLQVACVYGDLTERLSSRLGRAASLDVVDVAPVQLENLRRKLGATRRVAMRQEDSANLTCANGSYDCVLVFFLLHEQPDSVRMWTIREVFRAVKPGGKVVFVDYHRPRRSNPFRYVMASIFKALEPYAMDLWQRELQAWFPADVAVRSVEKQTYFGDLYQKVVINV